MTTIEPLGESIARVPDNVRAEIARRRTTLEVVAQHMTTSDPRRHLSYATLKRRMTHPEELTLRNIADLARFLRIDVRKILDWNGGTS